MDNALQFIGSDDRARRRFVELVTPFVAAMGAWFQQVAPLVSGLAQAVERVEATHPVEGYEPLFFADGYDPLEARFLAVVALALGRKLREENLAEKRLAGAIAALSKARGRGSLSISRRAKRLEEALSPLVEALLSKAWAMASLPDSFHMLETLVALAIDRDPDACQRLTEIASALRPGLRDPRGRVPSLESATHQIFLELREKGAYTYDDLLGDRTDVATKATRIAMHAPDFDPRPAQRRQRKEQARPRG
jgi:hypothetical protein